METPGDLVALLVELPPRMQGGHDHLGGRAVLGGMHVHGDAAAVVHHRHAVALVDEDLDLLAVARQRLVDGVVHHLVDEVVQSVGTGGPDVHGGALSDGVESFEDLDGTRVVAHVSVISPV